MTASKIVFADASADVENVVLAPSQGMIKQMDNEMERRLGRG